MHQLFKSICNICHALDDSKGVLSETRRLQHHGTVGPEPRPLPTRGAAASCVPGWTSRSVKGSSKIFCSAQMHVSLRGAMSLDWGASWVGTPTSVLVSGALDERAFFELPVYTLCQYYSLSPIAPLSASFFLPCLVCVALAHPWVPPLHAHSFSQTPL